MFGQRVLCHHGGDREHMPDHHNATISATLDNSWETVLSKQVCGKTVRGNARAKGTRSLSNSCSFDRWQISEKKQIVIRFKQENSVPVRKCPVGSPVRTHWLLTHARTDGQVENNTAAAHPVGRRRHTNSVRLSREQNHNSSCQQNDITIAVIFLLFHWPI